MSPMEKRRVALFSVALSSLVFLGLTVYFIPTFAYLLFIFAACCFACSYNPADGSVHAREGRHPGPRLAIPAVLRRWLPARTTARAQSGGRLGSRGGAARFVKGPLAESARVNGGRRPGDPADFFRETEELGGSPLIPRDALLLRSNTGERDGSRAAWRWGAAGSRELRERVARASRAAPSTRRTLSFRDSWGSGGRVVIAPQQNYLLQPTCSSPLGALLAPAPWSARQKNMLAPCVSAVAHSPVTVKIARPDHSSTRSPLVRQFSSPRTLLSPTLGLTPDPCSREAVLRVLGESRKSGRREPEDDSSATPRKSKRRRHDSGGSANSAFEPLMANGLPSQLVPRPGRMKRGINTSVVEDSPVKRSRASSVGSTGLARTTGGGDSSTRNPIHSSYSSSQGPVQTKSSSLCVSPLSSPESSRSQTPDRPPKKAREKEVCSPNSQSPLNSDRMLSSQVSSADGNTQTSKTQVLSSPVCSSRESEVTRKRKIQLVSSQRGEHISLPPPPQLGYTITSTDLDLEKKAALNQIKSALEEPDAAKQTPTPGLVAPTTTADSVSSAAPPVSGTLLLGSISIVTPTPSLTPSIPPALPATSSCDPASTHSSGTFPPASSSSTACTAQGLTNPQMDSPSPAPGVSAPLAGEVLSATSYSGPESVPVSFTPTVVEGGVSGALAASASWTASASLSTPALGSKSASQHSPPMAALMSPPRMTFPTTSSQVFPKFGVAVTSGLVCSVEAPAPQFTSTVSKTASAAETTSSMSVAPLFKPIFGAVSATPSATGSSQEAATLKPIFGVATASNGFGQPPAVSAVPPVAPSGSGSVLGVLTTTTTTIPANTLDASRGQLASTSTSSGLSFQFGAKVVASSAPTISSTVVSTYTPAQFQFGASPITAAPPMSSGTTAQQSLRAPLQSAFIFGQTTSGGSFSGFGAAVSTPSSTTATPAPVSQPTFSFGKPSVNGPVAFPSMLQTPTIKPLTFGMINGGGDGCGTPINSTIADSPIEDAPSLPVFPSGSSSATAASCQSSATLPVPGPTLTFGGSSVMQSGIPAPGQSNALQPATGSFNFQASVMGNPFSMSNLSSTPTQMSDFSFGGGGTMDGKQAFGTSTPMFGQSPGGLIPSGTPNFGGVTPSPFGTPSFSIGTGSRPTGARQRLQARRQHIRKK